MNEASVHYVIGDVNDWAQYRASKFKGKSSAPVRLLPDVRHAYGLSIFPWDIVHYGAQFKSWTADERAEMRTAVKAAQSRALIVNQELATFNENAQTIIDKSTVVNHMLEYDHYEDCMVVKYPHPASACTCLDVRQNWMSR